MSLQGRVALVTGATRGIGCAIAKRLRSQGAYVIGTHARVNPVTDDTCNEYFQADFSIKAQIMSCAELVQGKSPDILVNNAGVNKISPFEQIDHEDFLRIHQVNVFAPLVLCQAALPGMRAKKWGRIVNVSSVWGKVSKEFRAAYSASKFALDGLTIALAAEHTENGILANCVAPGFTDTELTRSVLGEVGARQLAMTVPARRLAGVSEIAEFVAWLCSEENTYIAGQNIAIDGGFTRV